MSRTGHHCPCVSITFALSRSRQTPLDLCYYFPHEMSHPMSCSVPGPTLLLREHRVNETEVMQRTSVHTPGMGGGQIQPTVGWLHQLHLSVVL
mmetsp:Transcript_63438/g.102230  ORF Transcript_63438/g.102230 Transcript_63438/m.102230 type:complete len:93 (+) Transcript_63438:1522-1800(+)